MGDGAECKMHSARCKMKMEISDESRLYGAVSFIRPEDKEKDRVCRSPGARNWGLGTRGLRLEARG